MVQGTIKSGRVRESAKPQALENIKGGAESPVIPILDNKKIGVNEIAKATEILRKYKSGKANLENKIRENEQFWKLRQWGNQKVKSTTWLWMCLQGRYSDVMDSYPSCNIKARQGDDVRQAKILSSIIPVILEQNRYEETYSDIAWYTLKQGGSVQGIFWDNTKHNGLGDISIKKIDLLNFFWQPGITDIQKSANIFTTELVDNDVLLQKYPDVKGHLGKQSVTVAKYMYDDTVDTSDKSVVIDWYYHTVVNGKRTLQYVKYVNDFVLFASENETEAMPDGLSLAERGYYDHGNYPFAICNLYPIEGSLIGYGLTDIGKSTQQDIDILNQALIDNAIDGATPRYFAKENTAINEAEYLDRQKKIIHVAGNLDEINIKAIDTKPLDNIYVSLLNIKTDELKQAMSNQDVSNGSAASGVTAASAIAALQEAAGKNARSTNKEFYRAYRDVIYQVIELIRQFYTQPRMFRIAPDAMTGETYITFDNSGIVPQKQNIAGIDMGLRLPEFDVDVTAEKASPYKKMERNELALNFYAQGFFNPQMADQALACLEIMDFEHKDTIVKKIQSNQSMQTRLLQFEQLALRLAQQVNPQMADQISKIILSEGGNQMPSGGEIDLTLSDNPQGDSRVEAARKQAQESTQI